MPLFKFIFLNFLLFSVLLINCNTPNQIQEEKDNTTLLNYVKDVKEIKATCTSYSDYVSKMNEIQNKYNFNYTESEDIPITSPDLSPQRNYSKNNNDNKNLKKVKTNIFDNNFLATKWGEYEIESTFYNTYTVANNGTISASLESISGTYIDPFLVLYTVDNGDPSDDPSLQQDLTVRAFNDDYTGLYPQASWVNNSGSPKDVTILTFAYSSYAKGLAKIKIDNGNDHYEGTIVVRGTAFFGDMGYMNGAGNTIDLPDEWVISDNIAIATSSYFEEIYAKFYTWGEYAPKVTDNADTYIWAFNFSSNKGIANDFLADEGNSSGSATARYVNEDITFNPDFTFPHGSWHYPNVIVLAGHSTGGKANILQIREFTRN
jgi:hypothetical protein